MKIDKLALYMVNSNIIQSQPPQPYQFYNQYFPTPTIELGTRKHIKSNINDCVDVEKLRDEYRRRLERRYWRSLRHVPEPWMAGCDIPIVDWYDYE